MPFKVNGGAQFTTSLWVTSNIYGTNLIGSAEFGQVKFNTNECIQILAGSESNGVALKIMGDGYVNGTVEILSDERIKKNIETIDKTTIFNKLNTVEGKTYQKKSYDELVKMHESNIIHFSVDTIDIYEAVYNMSIEDKSKSVSKEEIIAKYYDKAVKRSGVNKMINDSLGIRINAPHNNTKTKYGLIAQEVMAEFPELVGVDSTSGLHSINYIGFIPILIEALKETNEQLAALEKEIYKLNKEKLKSASINDNPDIEAQLMQNVPNPFSHETEIDYYLNDDVAIATIYVYDMNGTQKLSLPVNDRGYSSVKIQGSQLTPGMYMYTLIADGLEVDTKKMILTD